MGSLCRLFLLRRVESDLLGFLFIITGVDLWGLSVVKVERKGFYVGNPTILWPK